MNTPHRTQPCQAPTYPWRSILAGALLIVIAQAAHAQLIDEAVARSQMAEQRSRADARYEQDRWECSKRFVVTSCLEKARAEHRAVIEALDDREAEIDSRLRHERAEERLAIIQQKTDALARLAPVPTDQRAADSTPLTASQPLSTRSGTSSAAARSETDAAAERAARARAESSARRRAEAERRRLEREQKKAGQKPGAAGLPERPEIPLPIQ